MSTVLSETTEGNDVTMGDENQIKPGPTTTTTIAAQMRKPEPNAQADEAMKKYRATMMDLSAAFPSRKHNHYFKPTPFAEENPLKSS